MDYAAYYGSLYRLLCEVRAERAYEMSVEEWWERRLDPTARAYKEAFAVMDHVVDTGDERWASMSPEQQSKFWEREQRRLTRGWWVKVPEFQNLTNKTQAELRKRWPMAGQVCLLTADHYFSQMYLRVPSKNGYMQPQYYRRDDMLYDWMEILERYPLPPMQGRERLHVHKKRGCHYTHTLQSRHLRSMTMQKTGGYWGGAALDIGVKLRTFCDDFRNMYATLPEWYKPKYKLANGNMKDGFNGTKVDDQGGDFYMYHPHPKTGLRGHHPNRFTVRTHDGTKWEQPRPSRGDIDESGLCKRPESLISKMSGALIDGTGVETGFMTVGGTSDANNQELHYLEDVVRNPEIHRAHIFFYGEQHLAGPVDRYGRVDPAPIVLKIKHEREQLELANQHQTLVQNIIKRPICLEDCFIPTIRQRLPIEAMRKQEELIHKLQEQATVPEEQRVLTGWFAAEGADLSRIVFVPSSEYNKRTGKNLPSGGWRVLASEMRHANLEHSMLENKKRGVFRPDNIYFAASDNVDSTRTDEELSELSSTNPNLSSNAMVVMSCLNYQPVAYYRWRHTNPEEDYLQMLYGALYWNCYLCPEANLQGQIEWTRRFAPQGYTPGAFLRYLYPMPFEFGGNWRHGKSVPQLEIKRGIRTGTNKLTHFDHYMPAFWEEHVDKVFFAPLIEACRKWNIENKKGTPDLGMALMICLVGIDHFIKTNRVMKPVYREKSDDMDAAFRAALGALRDTKKPKIRRVR